MVAIDLDGTLLDSLTTLRPRGRAALVGLLAKEIPVAIATARAARSVAAILGEDLFSALHVVHVDGAIVETRGNQVARHHFALPTDAALVATEIVQNLMPAARIVAELDGWEFGCDQEMASDKLWEENRATPDMVLPLAGALERPVAKIAVNGFGQSVRLAEEAIRRELGEAAKVISHADGTFCAVVAPGISKRSGVAKILSGEMWRRVVAFGDDLSDIDLLSASGYGFAMGNAAPEVIRAARYQTATNDADGVAVVLERLFT